MKVILHLGVHRAGSSTIQALLNRHRAGLAAQGVSTVTRAQLQADACMRQLTHAHRSSLRALVAAVSLARAEGDTLVISEENLLGLTPRPGARALYPGHPRLIRTLEILGRLFEVSLRVVLRRQDTWLESLYSQRVIRGTTASFDEFMRGFDRTDLSWLPLVRALAAARVHSARVALLEDLFPRGTERDLAAFLELPLGPGADRSLKRHHQGLRGPMLNVLRQLRRAAPSSPLVAQGRLRVVLARFGQTLPSPEELGAKLAATGFAALVPLVPAALEFAAAEPPCELDPAQRRALLARVARENEALLRLPIVEGSGEKWSPA